MGSCCSTEDLPSKENNSASSSKVSHSKQKVVGRRGSGGHHQQQQKEQHHHHQQHQQQEKPPASPVSCPGAAMTVAGPLSTLQQQQQSQPPSAMMSVLTNKEREAILADPSISLPTKLILNPPFSCFSRFTEHIFLTGVGGITLENLKQHNIKLVVNVSQEVTNYSLPAGMLSYKYPLVDNYQTAITKTLHSAADLMYKVVKGGGNVVVYCTAGMSRSSAIVLAYAVKHLRAPLKQAFAKLQETRTYARPNLAFFSQLADFESTFLGNANSTKMVAETLDTEADNYDDTDSSSMNDGQAAAKAKAAVKPRKMPKPGEPSITVPDFYKKEYPHLFKMEVEEALAGNCPMANNIGAATILAGAATVAPVSTAAMSSATSATSSAASCLSAASKPPAGGGKQQHHLQKSSVVGGGGKSAIGVATTTTTYQTYELKPFVLEPISYPTVLAEIAKTRKKMKPQTAATAAMSVPRNVSPLSLKKKAKK